MKRTFLGETVLAKPRLGGRVGSVQVGREGFPLGVQWQSRKSWAHPAPEGSWGQADADEGWQEEREGLLGRGKELEQRGRLTCPLKPTEASSKTPLIHTLARQTRSRGGTRHRGD